MWLHITTIILLVLLILLIWRMGSNILVMQEKILARDCGRHLGNEKYKVGQSLYEKNYPNEPTRNFRGEYYTVTDNTATDAGSSDSALLNFQHDMQTNTISTYDAGPANERSIRVKSAYDAGPANERSVRVKSAEGYAAAPLQDGALFNFQRGMQKNTISTYDPATTLRPRNNSGHGHDGFIPFNQMHRGHAPQPSQPSIVAQVEGDSLAIGDVQASRYSAALF
jgi:hypothetical protein